MTALQHRPMVDAAAPLRSLARIRNVVAAFFVTVLGPFLFAAFIFAWLVLALVLGRIV